MSGICADMPSSGFDGICGQADIDVCNTAAAIAARQCGTCDSVSCPCTVGSKSSCSDTGSNTGSTGVAAIAGVSEVSNLTTVISSTWEREGVDERGTLTAECGKVMNDGACSLQAATLLPWASKKLLSIILGAMFDKLRELFGTRVGNELVPYGGDPIEALKKYASQLVEQSLSENQAEMAQLLQKVTDGSATVEDVVRLAELMKISELFTKMVSPLVVTWAPLRKYMSSQYAAGYRRKLAEITNNNNNNEASSSYSIICNGTLQQLYAPYLTTLSWLTRAVTCIYSKNATALERNLVVSECIGPNGWRANFTPINNGDNVTYLPYMTKEMVDGKNYGMLRYENSARGYMRRSVLVAESILAAIGVEIENMEDAVKARWPGVGTDGGLPDDVSEGYNNEQIYVSSCSAS